MSLTKTVGLFAGTTLALTGGAFASTEANNDALKQIEELRKQVAELRAQNGDNWLTEARASEIKGLVQDVLADADTRASLQGAASTAGWDNGFFLASADGNFRLNVSGGAQLRWTFNDRSVDSVTNPGVEDQNWGFASRHAGMTFAGHIVDPSWQYNISFAFFDASGDYDGEDTGGTAFLTDWYVLKDFGGFYFRGGQFVAPFARERMMSDYNLQFLGRSNTNFAFGLGRTQGIELGYISDMFRFAAAYSDGLGTNSPTQNRGFSTAGNNPPTDFALSGRVEVKLAGNWKQFESQQSWRGDEFGLLLGGGAYYQTGRNGSAAFPAGQGTDGDDYGFTADVAASFGGFNAIAAVFWASSDSDWVNGTADQDRSGFMAQAGFFLTDEFELVGRYEYGDFENLGGVVDANTQSTLTLGGNWYFARNRAKWQTDLSYAFHSMGSFAIGGNGWYEDVANANGELEDGQLVFRTGITISF